MPTTVLQTGPVDARTSRQQLPREYDRRALVMLVRAAAVAAAFAAAASWVSFKVFALVGARQLLVLVAASEVAFYFGVYRKRWAHTWRWSLHARAC